MSRLATYINHAKSIPVTHPRRTNTSRIQFHPEAYPPSKFYIGTYFPNEPLTRIPEETKTQLANNDGRAKGRMERPQNRFRAVDRRQRDLLIEQTSNQGTQGDSKENSDGRSTRLITGSSSLEETKSNISAKSDQQALPSLEIGYDRPEVNFFVGQWERSQDDLSDKLGRLHFQFFVEFRDKVRLPQARRYLSSTSGTPFTGWLEPARSERALEYCRKERSRIGGSIEYGLRGGKTGTPARLTEVLALMQNGTSFLDVSTMYPDLVSRNKQLIQSWEAYYDRPRDSSSMPTVECYYGHTGSGKSWKAFIDHPDAFRKMPGKWWDGYKGEKVVIIEDFKPPSESDWKTGGGEQIQLDEWLRILDRYPHKIQYKGGTKQLQATHFIFTSNYEPSGWFTGHHQFPAFLRRVSRFLLFTGEFISVDKDGMTGVITPVTIESSVFQHL